MCPCHFPMPMLKAYVEREIHQRTKEITFHAAGQQSVTISLPSGVRFHNVSTGSTSTPGAKVTIQGGTKFYLSAPLTQAEGYRRSICYERWQVD